MCVDIYTYIYIHTYVGVYMERSHFMAPKLHPDALGPWHLNPDLERPAVNYSLLTTVPTYTAMDELGL